MALGGAEAEWSPTFFVAQTGLMSESSFMGQPFKYGG